MQSKYLCADICFIDSVLSIMLLKLYVKYIYEKTIKDCILSILVQ